MKLKLSVFSGRSSVAGDAAHKAPSVQAPSSRETSRTKLQSWERSTALERYDEKAEARRVRRLTRYTPASSSVQPGRSKSRKSNRSVRPGQSRSDWISVCELD